MIDLQVIRGFAGLGDEAAADRPPGVQLPGATSDAAAWGVVLGGAVLVGLLAWAAARGAGGALGDYGW